jgi:hypothetical protein
MTTEETETTNPQVCPEQAVVHTPGPWLVLHPEDDDYPAFVYGPSMMERPVCEVFGWQDYRTENGWCHRKNAALIAAAPDLLKACIDVLAAIQRDHMDGGSILWLDHALPGVHESAEERLKSVIEDATKVV